MERIKKMWLDFEEKYPKASQWVREGGLFLIVSYNLFAYCNMINLIHLIDDVLADL